MGRETAVTLRRSLAPETARLGWSILSSVMLLTGSLVLNFFAAQFATISVSNPVTDIILDNIPVVNVEMIFVEGPLILWALVLPILLARPAKAPFVLKSVALFIIIRSFFIVLTHIGPFPVRSPLDYGDVMRIFTSGGDLFFSGHTGSAFLLALIFWRTPALRWIFLAASVVFACGVLVGHLHYSIDVFAAFFITYGIADLAKFLFPKDYSLFQHLDRLELPSLAAAEQLGWRRSGRA